MPYEDSSPLGRLVHEHKPQPEFNTDGIDLYAREQLAENAKHQYPQFYSFVEKLKTAHESVVIAVQSDSTGDGTTDWVYLLGQFLASKYPAYTVKHSLWNDTSQYYETPTILSVGSKGFGHIQNLVGGVDALYITDAVGLHITGDIDLKFHGAADVWAGADNQTLINKLGTAGARSYVWYIEATSGKLVMYWSNDGTALITAKSSVGLSLANESSKHLRCTMDVNNGSGGYTIKFYTSDDGVTWTQLGSDVVGGSITTINSNTATIGIGQGSMGRFLGKIYSCEIRNGMNGAVVASPDFAMIIQEPGNVGATLTDKQGNSLSRTGYTSTLTWGTGSPVILILNGSVSGQKLDYAKDVTRFAKLLMLEPDLNFISYGHNEGNTIDYKTPYLAYIDQIRAKYPACAIVPVAQNPELPPMDSASIAYHMRRCRQIIGIAASRNCICIDVYSAMVKSANLASYINSDGVHPILPGSQFWRDTIAYYFNIFD